MQQQALTPQCVGLTSTTLRKSAHRALAKNESIRQESAQQTHSPLEETAEPTERDDQETEEEKPARRSEKIEIANEKRRRKQYRNDEAALGKSRASAFVEAWCTTEGKIQSVPDQPTTRVAISTKGLLARAVESQQHARYTEQTARRREQVDVIELQCQRHTIDADAIDEMNGSKKTGKSVQ
jgi:hypothetical protein